MIFKKILSFFFVIYGFFSSFAFYYWSYVTERAGVVTKRFASMFIRTKLIKKEAADIKEEIKFKKKCRKPI